MEMIHVIQQQVNKRRCRLPVSHPSQLIQVYLNNDRLKPGK